MTQLISTRPLVSATRRIGVRVIDPEAVDKPWLVRLRRVLGAVTPLGWAMVGGGLVALTLGLVAQWREYVVIGLGLTALFALGSLSTMGSAGYRAEIHMGRKRIRLGESASGTVALTGRSRLSLSAGRVELPVGSATAAFRVPRLLPGQIHTESFAIAGERRGAVQIGPVLSVRADPFGAIRRTHAWTESEILYIHPRTVRIEGPQFGFLKDIEGLASDALTSRDMAFHALREYVPGDDLRSVHWRTTARTGRLMVRQYEETHRSHVLIMLDLDRGSYPGEAAFEDAVSAAASILLCAVGGGRTASLVTDRGVERAPTTTGLLDALAAVALTDRPVGVVNLVTQAFQDVSNASIGALVTGSRLSLDTVRTAANRLPEHMPVASIQLGAPAVARRISGRRMFAAVPALDSLPEAVGRWR